MVITMINDLIMRVNPLHCEQIIENEIIIIATM